MLPNMVSAFASDTVHTNERTKKKKIETDNSKDVNFFFICYFGNVFAPSC